MQFWDVNFDDTFKGGNSNPVNNPENINKIYKQHKKNDKYKFNRYKFDLQKTFPYDSNSEQRGSRGGRFRIRYNKDGKPYRQYYIMKLLILPFLFFFYSYNCRNK